MAYSWIDPVRSTRQLTVYADSSMGNGAWQGILASAISQFNQLAQHHQLGVTLTTSRQPPAADERGGADVSVQAVQTRISFTYAGVSTNEAFDGTRLHGQTILFRRLQGNRIFKAFIFLPGQPLVLTPRERRAVGLGVRQFILAHEFVHACGLPNAEHTQTRDLFQAYPSVIPGSAPEGDGIETGRFRRDGAPITMPPLLISDDTVRLIRSAWAQTSPPAPRPTPAPRPPAGRTPAGGNAPSHRTHRSGSVSRPHATLNHFRQPGIQQYIPFAGSASS